MGLTIATLETLFTANVKDFERKADAVDKTTKALAKSDPEVKVTADNTKALAGMGKVEADARKIDATTATAKLDADASKAKAGVGEAAAALARIDGDTATIKVDADTSGAKADIRGLGDEGGKAGEDAGEGLSAGIIGALIALPVAGTIVAIGASIGKSLLDGLQVEMRSDRLMAQTGLDPRTIAPIARAAGEAYANNFGESIAGNMDTARVAIQQGILDVDGTEKDSQRVIEALAGVADIIGEEIAPVAKATAQLIRTGLAKDATQAFDLIVKGQQLGINKGEDLLDTFNEYSTQFRKLGIDGPRALGLMNQAIQGGARDSDIAADAFKEFSIRAVDGSKLTGESFAALGLNGKKMSDDIAAGGPRAVAALDQTMDKLRGIKDPAERAQIAVGLFGTQTEDLGDALYAMDLSTAVAELGTVEGAADSAIAAIGTNTAGTIASAQRNIEVAADGIKGALASAFTPQLEGFSSFVTENRSAVMQFLLDMANGAIDAGRALVNATAAGIEGFGNLVGTAGPAMMDFLTSVVSGVASVMSALDPTGVLGLKDAAEETVASYNKMQDGALAGFAATKSGAKTAADALRENLIENGIDPVQAKLNEVAVPLVAQAGLHDASVKMAKSIDGIGTAAGQSKTRLDTHTGAVNMNTASGKLLDEQLRAAVQSLDAEATAGAKAGESQAQLTTRYGEGRAALIRQLEQMGLTTEQAQALADKYRAIPGKAETKASLEKATAEADIVMLQSHIDDIKQGKKPGISAYTEEGRAKIAALQAQIDVLRGKTVVITANIHENYTQTAAHNLGSRAVKADGGHVTAANGMDRQSMIAPGGANILWAEPETGWETYISGKPSQRSRNIGLLAETARRFGLAVMPTARADGSPTTSAGAASVVDMSGVRADLRAVAGEVRSLGDRFGAELQHQARTIQTMQRQMA